MRLLDELYAMGLHLSIDDFGTGYSSLSALQQFPIGTLKIDQSFVRDVSDDAGDATIVRTIIEMGRSLGMEVIAEGVESQRQLEFLRSSGCHFGAGHACSASRAPRPSCSRCWRGRPPAPRRSRTSCYAPTRRPRARLKDEALLTLSHARVRRGPQILLDEATVSVFRGEKVGIVGRNGCGKSTLLALIRGELSVDAGDYSAPANLAIASVAQDLPDTDTPLGEYIQDGDLELRAAQARAGTGAGARRRHARGALARALRGAGRLQRAEPRGAAGRRARLRQRRPDARAARVLRRPEDARQPGARADARLRPAAAR